MINGAAYHVRCTAAMHPTPWCMARLEGFEPTTYGLEVRSSIHLSYRRLATKFTTSFSFRQDEITQRRNPSEAVKKIRGSVGQEYLQSFTNSII
jgi:hypothetical protein